MAIVELNFEETFKLGFNRCYRFMSVKKFMIAEVLLTDWLNGCFDFFTFEKTLWLIW